MKAIMPMMVVRLKMAMLKILWLEDLSLIVLI
jgi:hypothetical protein